MDFDDFGVNIPATTGHQMSIQIPTQLLLLDYLGKPELMRYYILYKAVLQSTTLLMHAHKSHLVHVSVTLADSLSNCPVVQLPTVNVRNVSLSREHKHADGFSMH